MSAEQVFQQSSQPLPTQIIVCVYNRPDFLIYQYLALCKYIQGPWSLVVVSDAEIDHNDFDLEFKRICRQLNIRHVRMPPYLQTVRGASPRAGNALDWALKNYAYNYSGLTIVLDSDMWPVRAFDPQAYMRHSDGGLYDIAGVYQTVSHQGYWIRYLWMALMVINGSSSTFQESKPTNNIRFMNAVSVEGMPTDAGGPMHYYLQNNPHLRIKAMKHLWSGTWTIDELVKLGWNSFNPYFLEFMQKEKADPEINGFGEILSDYFYHHRAGSNWNGAGTNVLEKRASHLASFFRDTHIIPSLCYSNATLGALPPKYPVPRALILFSETLKRDDIEKKTEPLPGMTTTNKEWITYICTSIDDIESLDIAGYVLQIEDEYLLDELDDNAVSDLILLHESLQDSNAVISLMWGCESDEESLKCDDSPHQLIPSTESCVKSNLSYYYPGHLHRPGMLTNRKIYELSNHAWLRIIEKKITSYAEKTQIPITTEMRLYSLKKQHQYQIVVIGKKHSDEITVQLECRGDMFFGQLDAKEFALNTEPTLISWDFYNKFEDKIAIGLRVTDNRPNEADRQSIPVNSLTELRCAYLTCIGPLN